MTNIIKLPINTQVDLDAATMLRNIAEDAPKHVFVICWPDDGSLPTYHSTTSDIATVLMRINEFTHKYYNGDFNDD